MCAIYICESSHPFISTKKVAGLHNRDEFEKKCYPEAGHSLNECE